MLKQFKPIKDIQKKDGNILLISDGLSTFGSWVDFLAILSLSAYFYNASPYQMFFVAAANTIPGMIISPQLGKMCDNGEPNKILRISLISRAIASCLIFMTEEYFIFLAVLGFRSLVTAVSPIAINVLAIQTIHSENQTSFFSKLNIINNFSKVLAPVLGAGLSSLSSENTTLMLSCLLSLSAFIVLSLSKLSLKSGAKPTGTKSTNKQNESKKDKSKKFFLTILGIYFSFVFIINNHLPIILKTNGFDKSLLGIVIGFAGAGNILSGLWLARSSVTPRLNGELSELIYPCLIQAIGFILLGFIISEHSIAPYCLPATFLIIGILSARFTIATSIYLAKNHSCTMGRTTSSIQVIQNSMMLIGPLFGAYLIDSFNSKVAFWTSGSIGLFGTSLIAILYILSHTNRLKKAQIQP